MHLAQQLDLAKAHYAALPRQSTPAPWDSKAERSDQYLRNLQAAQEAVTALTRQIRVAERQVMAHCLDLAHGLPEDMYNFTGRRELIHALAALLKVEEQTL
jgi:hypothetical protein